MDISKVDTSKFTDAYFSKQVKASKKATDFFSGKSKASKKVKATAERKADQKALDEPLLAAIKDVPYLAAYLASTFSLQKGVYPHELKF